ncbi:MAG: FHA domain-containing protein [Pseudomonadota bacterium]
MTVQPAASFRLEINTKKNNSSSRASQRPGCAGGYCPGLKITERSLMHTGSLTMPSKESASEHDKNRDVDLSSLDETSVNEQLDVDSDSDTLETLAVREDEHQEEAASEDTVSLEILREQDPDPAYISSLSRLETDLLRLQAKWQDVEEMLQERDQQIKELEVEADEDRNTIVALEKQVQSLVDEKETLTSNLGEVQKESDVQRSSIKEADFQVRHLEEELEKAKSRYDTLQEEHRGLERTLERETRAAIDAANGKAETSEQNNQQKTKIQELEAYIDGRKSKWNEQRDELARQARTIKELEEKISEEKKALADANQKNEQLRERILELEKNVSELAGRHAERDASNSELRESLEAQNQELGGLRSEAQRFDEKMEGLTKQISAKDDRVESLSSELRERKSDYKKLEKELAAERKTAAESVSKLDAAQREISKLEDERHSKTAEVGDLRANLGELSERLKQTEPTADEHVARINSLEQAATENAKREQALRDELSQALNQLKAQSDDVAEKQVRIATFDAELSEKDAEIERLQKNIATHLDRIQNLETALDSQKDHFNLLQKNADRISAIQSGVRQLDSQIRGSQSDQQIDKNRHTIVVEDPESDRELRYLLQKDETTIGRSRTCDIRVDSRYISRQHVRLVYDGDTIVIEDAGSTNGFQVDGQFVSHHRLKSGDSFDIGMRRFHYHDTLEQDARE